MGRPIVSNDGGDHSERRPVDWRPGASFRNCSFRLARSDCPGTADAPSWSPGGGPGPCSTDGEPGGPSGPGDCGTTSRPCNAASTPTSSGPTSLMELPGLGAPDWVTEPRNILANSQNFSRQEKDVLAEPAALAGDPVDLSSGVLVINNTDLSFSGSRGPLALVRNYHSLSSNAGPFGIGTGHNYSLQLDISGLIRSGQGQINLVMPDGNQRSSISLPRELSSIRQFLLLRALSSQTLQRRIQPAVPQWSDLRISDIGARRSRSLPDIDHGFQWQRDHDRAESLPAAGSHPGYGPGRQVVDFHL